MCVYGVFVVRVSGGTVSKCNRRPCAYKTSLVVRAVSLFRVHQLSLCANVKCVTVRRWHSCVCIRRL